MGSLGSLGIVRSADGVGMVSLSDSTNVVLCGADSGSDITKGRDWFHGESGLEADVIGSVASSDLDN